MPNRIPDQILEAEQQAKSQAAIERAEKHRERFRQAQAIALKKAKSEAAGRAPRDEDVARMVADFMARGGQITICPAADDDPLLGPEGEHIKPAA